MENIKLPTKGKSEVIASGMYRYLLTVWQGDVYLIERFDKDWKNPNVVLETMDSDKVMEYIDNFLAPIK